MTRQVVFLDELQQDSPEWLDWRSKGIGSSDVALLMNPEPQFGRTIHALWMDRIGYEKFGYVANEHTKRGKDLEPVIRDMVNELLGTEYIPKCVLRNDSTFLRASLDGYDPNTDSILELKAPAEKNFLKWLKSWEIPSYYTYQMQYQMLVTDAKYGVFGFYNAMTKDPYIKIVEPDYAMQVDIERRCNIFWKAVQEKIPVGFKGEELSLFPIQPTIFVIMCDFNFVKTYAKFDYAIPIIYKPEARMDSFIYLCHDYKKLMEIKKLNPLHQVKFISIDGSPFNPESSGFKGFDSLLLDSLAIEEG